MWALGISCEYILPYRVGNETLADWREMYYEKYNGILDGLRNSDSSDREDPAAAARIITDSLTGPKKIFFTSAAPAALPHIGPVAADSRSGNCRDLVDFALYVCRALGIPCASDYMPFRGTGMLGMNGPPFSAVTASIVRIWETLWSIQVKSALSVS